MGNYVLAISQDIAKLSQRSDEVDLRAEYKRVSMIIKELKDTIRDNKDLVALSAPQLGYFDRVFCINFNNDIRAFVNPVITKSEGFKFVREVNPSIKDKEFIVPRSETIEAVYQRAEGTPESNKFEGIVASVFQQQVDMLDGVLISDIGLEVIPEFDKASEEEQEEVLKAFMEILKGRQDTLNKEIEEDPELKKIVDGAKFINAVAKGEVELEKIEKTPEIDASKLN